MRELSCSVGCVGDDLPFGGDICLDLVRSEGIICYTQHSKAGYYEKSHQLHGIMDVVDIAVNARVTKTLESFLE